MRFKLLLLLVEGKVGLSCHEQTLTAPESVAWRGCPCVLAHAALDPRDGAITAPLCLEPKELVVKRRQETVPGAGAVAMGGAHPLSNTTPQAQNMGEGEGEGKEEGGGRDYVAPDLWYLGPVCFLRRRCFLYQEGGATCGPNWTRAPWLRVLFVLRLHVLRQHLKLFAGLGARENLHNVPCLLRTLTCTPRSPGLRRRPCSTTSRRPILKDWWTGGRIFGTCQTDWQFESLHPSGRGD